MAAHFVEIQVRANARPGWQLKVAVHDGRELREQLPFPGLVVVFERLLKPCVGRCGVDMQTGQGADRPLRGMWRRTAATDVFASPSRVLRSRFR